MKRLTAGFCAAMILGGAGALAQSDDPYLWLEEVEGKAALEWVTDQNETLGPLENDPRFASLKDEALSVLTSKERLPAGQIHNGFVYNFWQDDVHIRGLWRRASVESYRSGEPEWDAIIDFDELAKREGENWIHGDIACLTPGYRHCMIEMSYGGKDAAVWREFDIETKSFVENGFFLPEAKSWLSWIDKDTLFVGTDWGAETLTDSGYPREVRRWARGTELADADMVMCVAKDDVWVFPLVERDGNQTWQFAMRGPSFFEREYNLVDADGALSRLPLPRNADMEGVLDGKALFRLREDWNYQGKSYDQGWLVAYDLVGGTVETVFAAAQNQSIESVGVGKTNVIIQYLDDVSGKAIRLARGRSGEWRQKPIDLPDNGVVTLISAGGGTDDAMLSYESMTTPASLFYVTAKNKAEQIMQMPPFYDAAGIVVEQKFATSSDGTKVPYFVMAKQSVLEKGNAPTVQYGYGGFLASILPVYYEDPSRPQHGALAGLMWVKRGGVLVLSNIRGGSEYGPRWHEAALKENRQKSFDDFIAISEDLIESGVTTPEKLGAIGRSNGGLLMGAMLTQRPDLYSAINIGVPLFDMKRYNKLLAGASWMGEYGNPDIEAEWEYISEYSPYQKLEADQPYPKVLFYTSTKDDRVHPGHARKAAARLDELGYDYFYYENIEGGHGGTANQEQLAYRTALEYMYFVHQLMGDEE